MRTLQLCSTAALTHLSTTLPYSVKRAGAFHLPLVVVPPGEDFVLRCGRDGPGDLLDQRLRKLVTAEGLLDGSFRSLVTTSRQRMRTTETACCGSETLILVEARCCRKPQGHTT